MQTQLNWVKCQGEVWCKLHFVGLDHAHFNQMEGVYIIWHGGPNPATVKVGQGTIRDQIATSRSESNVKQYENLGLFVTWASVPQAQRDGVVAYLATKLKPLVPHYSQTIPIEVNLPW
jgi:hypothetical protein